MFFWIGMGVAPAGGSAPERFVFSEPHMGTVWRMVIYADERESAQKGAEDAFTEIARLDRVLSDYKPDSEVRKLGVAETRVSAVLWDILRYSQELAEETKGAFDVTAGQLTRHWRRALRRGEFPDKAVLQNAKKQSGYQKLLLNEEARTVRLSPGMRIDLGAVGKGVALDAALKFVLGIPGITTALIDAGGDVLAGPAPPGRLGWKVAVRGSGEKKILRIANVAVATSGDLYQHTVIDGKRYSHIIDPRTGVALQGRVAATVLALTAQEADALASALCVLDTTAGAALLKKKKGTAARMTRQLPPDKTPEVLEVGDFRRWEVRR